MRITKLTHQRRATQQKTKLRNRCIFTLWIGHGFIPKLSVTLNDCVRSLSVNENTAGFQHIKHTEPPPGRPTKVSQWSAAASICLPVSWHGILTPGIGSRRIMGNVLSRPKLIQSGLPHINPWPFSTSGAGTFFPWRKGLAARSPLNRISQEESCAA